MSASTLALFAVAAFATTVTPGPTTLLTLSNATRHGVRFAAWGIVGALVSDGLLILAVALGLGSLLAASQTAFTALKWLGAAYLAWLGWKMLRAPRVTTETLRAPDNQAGTSRHKLMRHCLMIALTNPKALLFFSAFLPQFIDPLRSPASQFAELALVFTVVDALVLLAYAALGARLLRRGGAAVINAMNRCCGGLILALAGALAMVRRGAAA
jgi:threonine/homoserine/homoserine lactone efflux protein